MVPLDDRAPNAGSKTNLPAGVARLVGRLGRRVRRGTVPPRPPRLPALLVVLVTLAVVAGAAVPTAAAGSTTDDQNDGTTVEVDVVFLVDRTPRDNDPKRNNTTEAATGFARDLEGLGADGRYALLAYSSEAWTTLETNFTRDRADLEDTFSTLHRGEGTHENASGAVLAALDGNRSPALDYRPSAVTLVVVFTSGDDDSYCSLGDEAIAALDDRGALLVSVAADPPIDNGPPAEQCLADGSENDLRTIAEEQVQDGLWIDPADPDFTPVFEWLGLLGSNDGGDATDGNTTDGNTTDGNVTDGNTTDGNTTDGNVTDGNTTDGNTTDGNVTDGNTTDGNTTDGNVTDGNTTDSDGSSGPTDDGSTDDSGSDSETSDGGTTDSGSTDDTVDDGNAADSDSSDEPDGGDTTGDASGGGSADTAPDAGEPTATTDDAATDGDALTCGACEALTGFDGADDATEQPDTPTEVPTTTPGTAADALPGGSTPTVQQSPAEEQPLESQVAPSRALAVLLWLLFVVAMTLFLARRLL